MKEKKIDETIIEKGMCKDIKLEVKYIPKTEEIKWRIYGGKEDRDEIENKFSIDKSKEEFGYYNNINKYITDGELQQYEDKITSKIKDFYDKIIKERYNSQPNSNKKQPKKDQKRSKSSDKSDTTKKSKQQNKGKKGSASDKSDTTKEEQKDEKEGDDNLSFKSDEFFQNIKIGVEPLKVINLFQHNQNKFMQLLSDVQNVQNVQSVQCPKWTNRTKWTSDKTFITVFGSEDHNQIKGLLYYISPLSYNDIANLLEKKYDSVSKAIRRNNDLFSEAGKKGNSKLFELSSRGVDECEENLNVYRKRKEHKKQKQKRKERKKKEKKKLWEEVNEMKKSLSPEREGLFSLYWDVKEILEYNPELGKTLIESPNKFIEALKETYTEDYNHRFYNLPEDRVLNAEDVRKDHIDELVEIRGRVVSLSSVRPVIQEAIFKCPSCGTIIKTDCRGRRTIKKPTKCSCGRKQNFNIRNKKRVNQANLIFEDIHEQSRNPHTDRLKGYVINDLTEPKNISTFYPGNEVRAVGIVREVPIWKGKKQSTNLDFKLEVMYAEHTEQEVSIENIEKEEKEEIQEIAKRVDKEGLEVLSKSFAPSIYSYDEIKKALILQICNRRNEHIKDKVRNKSNILLMGDPGVGKSVLGEFAVRVSPGGRRGAGGTASTVGLTASVVKEEDDLGGWRVEPGAYALAKDIFFLDELNNIGEEEEQSRLQEGMSEQVITVDKANVHAELKVYSGLLAAANPVGGHFNIDQNYVEQFDIPSPILNRFDTIFVMKDEVNKEKDKGIARKMIDREKDSIDAEYGVELLKKYFVYVKSMEAPQMTKDVEKILEEIYTGERKNSSTKDLIINPRLLESLIRMIKASARTRLSDKIEKKDVQRALKILSKSQYEVNEYEKFKEKKEWKEIDNKVENPQEPKEQIEAVKKIQNLCSKYGKMLPKKLVKEEAGLTDNQLNKLRKAGEIHSPKEGHIQLL